MMFSCPRALGAIVTGCALLIAANAPAIAQSAPAPVTDGAGTASYLNEDYTDRAVAATPIRTAFRPLTGYAPDATTAFATSPPRDGAAPAATVRR